MLKNEVTIERLEKVIDTILLANERLENENNYKLSICVWGQHGIGKTHMVENYCKKNNYDYCYFPLANVEEKGDLAGMPDKNLDIQRTVTLSPDFFPNETNKKHGLFLIDDFNRADERIVLSIMQLVQNYQFLSNKLPKKWTIILTGNPNDMGYDVTEVDGAWLTRTCCCTLEFDYGLWIEWLTENNYDSKLIDFCLSEKDLILKAIKYINKEGYTSENITTPRSIVQYFETYQHTSNLSILKTLGLGFIDEEIVAAFIKYLKNKLVNLPDVKDILNDNWTNTKKELDKLFIDKIHQSSIGNILITNIKQYCTKNKHTLTIGEMENLKNILLYEQFPVDLRLSLRNWLMDKDSYMDILSLNDIYNLK